MVALALSLWGLYFVLTLFVRVALHRRRTGETGLAAMKSPPGSAEWSGELGQFTAIALGVAAPLVTETFAPLDPLDHDAVHAAGVVIFTFGLTVVVISQHAMRESWRIGIDPDTRTELVTTGPFALARNPIFTGVIAAQAGIALVVPNAPALVALALLVLSVEIQVRYAEEPYLRRIHGEAYAEYARSAGRFVPGVGRLRAGR